MANQSGNPQCPFCQLVANPEQTFDVHETEHFKAWLDINPRAKGHTMIVPKEHLTSMEELGDHVAELFDIIRIVMEKAKNGLDADGVSVVLNDGEAAGQRLEHFYAQVFPRFEDEENAGAPAGAVFQPMEDLEESDLQDISKQIESASFASGGKPRKQGVASNMIQNNRGDSQGMIVEKEEVVEEGEPDEEDAERDEDEEEDDEKKKKKRKHWDGDNYSWNRDGAEFQ